MNHDKPPPYHRLAVFFMFWSVSLLLFARQYTAHPMFDDFVYFHWFENSDWTTLHYLLNPRSGYFWIRPFTLLLCYMEYILFGSFMPGYRLAGITWHAGNALLIFILARKTLKMPPETALCAGWLFLLHPAAVQSVCYPSARSETVYIFFLLSAIILLTGFYTGTRGYTSLFAGLLLFIPAVLSKETAAVLIPIMICIMCIHYPGASGARRRLGLLVMLVVSGSAYFMFRHFLYGGIGGYGLGISTGTSPADLIQGPIRKLILDFPSAHFFPFSPDLIPFSSAARWIAVFLSAIILFIAFTTKTSWRTFLTAISIMSVSSAVLVLIVPYFESELLPPRYLYLGSAAVALLLAPVVTRKHRLRMPAVILLGITWSFNQYGFQRDFYRAGKVTEHILSTIDHYCYVLKSRGTIQVFNVPDRIGAISINIPHARDNVFNLQAHHRCGLAPKMDMHLGQGIENWNRYMASLPGRVEVYRTPGPNDAPVPGCIVIRLDMEDAMR